MDESVLTPPGQPADRSFAAMRERVELLEMAESLAAVGHWQIDVRAGRVFWSDEIYRIHGVTPETYTPRLDSAIDFYHPDDASRVAELVDSAISKKQPFAFEFRLVRPDGSVRHVQCRARITLSPDDQVETVFGVFQDVTDPLRTREALHESQMRFDLAVRGSNAGLWYWQIQTGELFWSPRFMEIVGLDTANFKPSFDEFSDRLHPADKERVLAALNAHLTRQSPYDVEYRLRKEEGNYLWIHARGQAEWDESGEPIRIAGSVEDIDVRKREESFREAVYAVLTTPDVDFSAKIVELLNLGCAYLDLELGAVCRRVDGPTDVEFSSSACADAEACESAVAGHLALTLETNGLVTHADLTAQPCTAPSPAQRETINVHYIGLPLHINGRAYGTLSFSSRSSSAREFESHEKSFVPVLARLLSYELSQRETLNDAVIARRSVERQQAELDRILNIVPVRIWYKDDKNRILRLNEKAAESMNMSVADAEGADTYDLFPAMARKYHEDDLRVIASGKPEFGIVEQYTPLDGPRGWTSTDKIPFDDAQTGDPRLLVVSQDISPIMNAQRSLERQAEELRQTNHDLDHFAYIASHDLRAPMRGIDQLATWIEEDLGQDIDSDVQSKLQLMQKRVRRMDRMLQDILTFARAGKRDQCDEDFDVHSVLQGVVEWLEPDPGITIAIHSGALRMRMSRTQFEQLFLNLIGNAIKHHDRTTGTITVAAQVELRDVVFSVRDDGPGIAVKHQQKVFEMFSTLKRRDECEGSGIGLAVVQRIARAYGGTVTLNSPLTERGTEFRIALPLALVPREKQVQPVA